MSLCPITQQTCETQCAGFETEMSIPRVDLYNIPFVPFRSITQAIIDKVVERDAVAGYCPSRDQTLHYYSDM